MSGLPSIAEVLNRASLANLLPGLQVGPGAVGLKESRAKGERSEGVSRAGRVGIRAAHLREDMDHFDGLTRVCQILFCS